ncbi:MAG: 50S ribosomal protein L31 [bacterium]
MKKDIHPQYFKKATITCACGSAMTVGSTQESTKVDICSQCHPLYTGKEKLIDKAGRVDKFRAKVAKAASGVAKPTKTRKKAS